MPLDDSVFAEAKTVLRDLLRIDTTNPPGNERPAVDYIDRLLKQAGIETTILEPQPTRANLVARLKGDGSEPPILLSCHLDVVPADPSRWTHPPFEAVEADGAIWGRGAIDMKGFAAMALAVFLQLKRQNVPLRRDVIFAAVADEEEGCDLGSAYLVDHHPDLIRAEYVINEVGGFSVQIMGKRYYLVQTAERGIAWLRVRVQGPPGHASQPFPEAAATEAGRVLRKLAKSRLPHHVSEPARRFITGLAKAANPLHGLILKGLLHPILGKLILHTLIPKGQIRRSMQANLSNTVNPTIIRAGSKINVIPSEFVIDLDGRVVPGSGPEALLREVRELIGEQHKIEFIRSEPATTFSSDTPVFEEIVKVIRERDPEGIVLPYIIPGFTDSRHYARLGSICYGFYPLKLPDDLEFGKMFHGDDERIPLESFRFGIEALYELVRRVAGKEYSCSA